MCGRVFATNDEYKETHAERGGSGGWFYKDNVTHEFRTFVQLTNYFSGEAAPYSRSSKNVSKHSGHAVHARKTPNCYSLVRAV